MQPAQRVTLQHFGNGIAIIFLLIILNSCKKDTPKPSYPAGSNQNINTWLLDSLKRYYYWSDALPGNPDITKTPLDFFASVRNASDRFSYILLPNDPSTVAPSNRGQYGFDYATIKKQNTGSVFGIIKFVLSDSPASRSGLNRGDYISKINNKTITEANAVALQQELLSGNKVTLTVAQLTGDELKDVRQVELTAGFTFEQPAISKIIENNNKKAAYLYVNDFSPGLAASLINTFAGFKAANVTELILDLRYNPGGQVAEAAGLSAMIAPGVNYNTPFIIYKGNKNGGTRTESLGDAATFDHTSNFNTLLQNNLALQKVFILGTAATASAAEVMINNLKPYLQVILVGEKTRGKDEASFKIYDARIPKQVEWEMHPIVYKLSNASGNGGYSAGISPEIQVNELASLPLVPLGDINDPLVKAAMNRISGQAVKSVAALKQQSGQNMGMVTVLTDTRQLLADQSTILTHR